MDDKIFDLLEKMYTEIQDLKVEVSKNNQSIDRLEDKMDANHKALYDGYKLTYGTEGQV